MTNSRLWFALAALQHCGMATGATLGVPLSTPVQPRPEPLVAGPVDPAGADPLSPTTLALPPLAPSPIRPPERDFFDPGVPGFGKAPAPPK